MDNMLSRLKQLSESNRGEIYSILMKLSNNLHSVKVLPVCKETLDTENLRMLYLTTASLQKVVSPDKACWILVKTQKFNFYLIPIRTRQGLFYTYPVPTKNGVPRVSDKLLTFYDKIAQYATDFGSISIIYGKRSYSLPIIPDLYVSEPDVIKDVARAINLGNAQSDDCGFTKTELTNTLRNFKLSVEFENNQDGLPGLPIIIKPVSHNARDHYFKLNGVFTEGVGIFLTGIHLYSPVDNYKFMTVLPLTKQANFCEVSGVLGAFENIENALSMANGAGLKSKNSYVKSIVANPDERRGFIMKTKPFKGHGELTITYADLYFKITDARGLPWDYSKTVNIRRHFLSYNIKPIRDGIFGPVVTTSLTSKLNITNEKKLSATFVSLATNQIKGLTRLFGLLDKRKI